MICELETSLVYTGNSKAAGATRETLISKREKEERRREMRGPDPGFIRTRVSTAKGLRV